MNEKSIENSFKLYLSTTRGLTLRTIKNYLSDFHHFWSWLILATRTPLQKNNLITKITPSLLSRYKSYLLTNNIAKSTVKRRLATVRIFCQFCLDQRWVKQNPALKLENPASINTKEREIHRCLSQFGTHLKKQRASKNTIKNYVADARQYLKFTNLPARHRCAQALAGGRIYESKNLRIKKYLRQLQIKGTKETTIKRKKAALRKFAGWVKKDLHGLQKRSPRSKAGPSTQAGIYTDNKFAKIINSVSAIPAYFKTAAIAIFITALGLFIYGQFIKKAPEQLAYPAAPTAPARVLSFQGRLTDNADTPIDISKDFVFKLYSEETGGSPIWTSNTCSITPDQDGIFSSRLGAIAGAGACGPVITSDVFTENVGVWLEVSVAGETLEPRQPIATSAYALNTETLQGFPPGTGASNIPYIDSGGDVVIAAVSPSIQSSSGTFAIIGQALTIQTPDLSAGDIAINPDGEGVLDLVFENSAPSSTYANDGVGGSLTVTNANLASGALYFGEVASPATGFDFIQFKSGSTPTEKFAVDALGNTDIAGDATISGTLSLGPQVQAYAGTCNADNKGKMYYDAGENKYYYCNGTSWTEMGGGGGGLWEDGTYGVYEDDKPVIVGADADFTHIAEAVGDLRVTSDLEVIGSSYFGNTDYLTINSTGDLTFTDADDGSSVTGPAGGTLTIQTGSNNNLALSAGTGDVDLTATNLDIDAGTIDLSTQTTAITLNSAANALNIDSNTLSIDAANDKVGVGTSTPIGKFHVTGAVTGKALAIFDETGNQNILTASASAVTVANLDRSGNLEIEGQLSDLSDATLAINDALSVLGADLTIGNGSAATIQTTGASNLTLDSGTGTLELIDNTNVTGNLDVSATFASGTADAFSVDSSGNIISTGTTGLTLSGSGADATVNDKGLFGGTIRAGSTSGVAYNAFGSSVVNASANMVDSADVYIQDALEVDGILHAGTIQLGFTAGSVLFVDGSGNIAQNNANFFWENTDKKLGIGTDSPVSKFHLTGAVTGKALAIFDETGDQDIFTASASATPRLAITHTGDLQFKQASTVDTSTGNLTLGAAGNLALGSTGDTIDINDSTLDLSSQTVAVTLSNSADALNFDSNTLSIDAASDQVGIGDASPDAKLEILAGSGAQLKLTNTDDTADADFTVDGTGDLTIDASGTKTILADDLQINGSDIIDSGTKTRISIGNAISLYPAYSGLVRIINESTGVSGNIYNPFAITRWDDTFSANYEVGMRFDLQEGSAASPTIAPAASISAKLADTANPDIYGKLFLSVRDGGNSDNTNPPFTRAVTIDHDGNVGIGTTDPSQLLEVSKNQNAITLVNVVNANAGTSARAGMQAQSDASSLFFQMEGSNYNAGAGYELLAADSGVFGTGGANGMRLITSASAPIIFGTGGYAAANEKMRITSGGNVGIGTTAPSSLLTLYSTSYAQLDIKGGSSSGFPLLALIDEETGGLQWNIENGREGDGILGFYRGGTKVVFDNAGNVGIGTTSPANPLDVASTGSLNIGILTGAADGYARTYYRTGDGTGEAGRKWYIGVRGDYTNNPYVWTYGSTTGSGFTDAMVITNSGNVGIGTTAPRALLDVYGLASVGNSGDSEKLRFSRNTDSFRYHSIATVHSSAAAGNSMSFLLHDAVTTTSQTTVMTLLGNGNVGIGTTNPDAELNIETTGSDTLVHIGTNVSGYDSRLSLTESDNYGMYFEYDGVANIGYMGMGSNVAPTGAWSKRIQMSRGGTEVAFMAGNVGIGTTSPHQKLELNGIAAIGNTDQGVLIWGTVGTGQIAGIDVASGAYNPLEIRASASTSIYLTTSGSVGIGTTAPTGKLQIDGGAVTIDKDYGIRGDSYNAGARNYIWALSSSYPDRGISYYEGSPDYISIHPGSTTSVLAVTDTGCVGIGITGPGQKLHVVGNSLVTGNTYIGATDSYFYRDAANRIATPDQFYVQGGSANTYLYSTNTYLGGSSGDSIHLRGNKFDWTSGGGGIINTSGNVGIGTTAPGGKLEVKNTGGAIIVINTNHATNNGDLHFYRQGSAKQNLSLRDGNHLYFYRYYNSNWYSTATVNYTNGYWSFPSGHGDFAEEMVVDENENVDAGDIVYAKTQDPISLGKSKQPYQSSVIGIISTQPGISLSDQKETRPVKPLSLSGRVPIKISSANGPILIGDPITSSSLPGIGMKATRAGPTVAKALESTEHWSEKTCPAVENLDSINWPENDEMNQYKPCFRVPDPSNPSGQVYVGKIMVFVNVSWYDPDIYLTDTGNIQLTSSQVNELTSYELKDKNNNIVDRIGAFAELAVAKIKAGLIETKELNAEDKIISPVVETEEISIKKQVLSIKNEDDNPVAEFDGENKQTSLFGDLLVKGTVNSEQLVVSEDATVSGTLYADNIVSKRGTFGELISDKISAVRAELEELVMQKRATDSGEITGSSAMAMAKNWETQINDKIQISNFQSNPNDKLPNELVIASSLIIQGKMTAEEAFINKNLLVGNIAINDNAISSLANALYIQPSGKGKIDFLAGIMTIEDNGNVTINGNLAVKGIVNSEHLTVSDDATVSGSLFANLINAETAQFNKINIATASAELIVADSQTPDIASNSAQLKSNAAAGEGIIPAGKNEVTIYTDKLTPESLVYITPATDTENQVLFVKSKTIHTDEEADLHRSFTVAIKDPLDINIKFNWWLIN